MSQSWQSGIEVVAASKLLAAKASVDSSWRLTCNRIGVCHSRQHCSHIASVVAGNNVALLWRRRPEIEGPLLWAHRFEMRSVHVTGTTLFSFFFRFVVLQAAYGTAFAFLVLLQRRETLGSQHTLISTVKYRASAHSKYGDSGENRRNGCF